MTQRNSVKKYIWSILLTLGFLNVVVAQSGLPPVYSIHTDSSFFTLDSTYFQILEDPTGAYTFEQVERSKAFYTDSPHNPNRRGHVYWMRMRVRNDLPHQLNLYLCNFNNDYIDMYWRDSSNRQQHLRAGYLVPESQISGHKGNREQTRLYFQLAPGQEITIYERAANVLWRYPVTYLVPQLQTEEGHIKSFFDRVQVNEGWKDDWFSGIGIGILILAVGYNLLIFFSTRERVYLYFCVCLLFFVVDRNTYYIQITFFPEYPYWFRLAANAFFIVFFVYFIQSVRQFIQPDQSLDRLNNVTSIALGGTLVLNLFQLLVFRYPIVPINNVIIALEISIRVVYVMVLIMTYRMMKRGVADARFVFIAIVPLFIWWCYTLLSNILGVYFDINLRNLQPDFFQYTESICLSWMIIFFSGALINRYNLTRRQVLQQAIEKEQYEKEREIERNRIMASQNERLEQQVQERTAELQQSLRTLRDTQNQLIQKEKLASLGELTAGIAHEIQNPLNFVNNFSEVSIELIDELRDEQQKKDRDEDLEHEILADIEQNLQKINQHGKRAGSIVRSMLEHSHASSGEKQPTNINDLVDEYVRLAYHGARAKDKSFNCELIINLSEKVPATLVVQQDIGRVLLNLFANAFFAVQEQKNKFITNPEYQPTVWISTELLPSERIEIRVKDNGTGIPDAIRQKIFQPFFTTKPTGQGTGLGLSLSYDIVTKGHGGELMVESIEGVSTEFIIRLPVVLIEPEI
ncbi:hypothetical protein GCM10028806_57520 [Spirosoma terrae]